MANTGTAGTAGTASAAQQGYVGVSDDPMDALRNLKNSIKARLFTDPTQTQPDVHHNYVDVEQAAQVKKVSDIEDALKGFNANYVSDVARDMRRIVTSPQYNREAAAAKRKRSTSMYNGILAVMIARPLSEGLNVGSLMQVAAGFAAAYAVGGPFKSQVNDLATKATSMVASVFRNKYGAEVNASLLPTPSEYAAHPEGYDKLKKAVGPMGLLAKKVMRLDDQLKARDVADMTPDNAALQQIGLTYAAYRSILELDPNDKNYLKSRNTIMENLDNAVRDTRNACLFQNEADGITEADIDYQVNLHLGELLEKNSPVCDAFEGLSDGSGKVRPIAAQTIIDHTPDGQAIKRQQWDPGFEIRDDEGNYHRISVPTMATPFLKEYIPEVAESKNLANFTHLMGQLSDAYNGNLQHADVMFADMLDTVATGLTAMSHEAGDWISPSDPLDKAMDEENFQVIPGCVDLESGKPIETKAQAMGVMKRLIDCQQAFQTALVETLQPGLSEQERLTKLTKLQGAIRMYNKRTAQIGAGMSQEMSEQYMKLINDGKNPYSTVIDGASDQARDVRNAAILPMPFITRRQPVFGCGGTGDKHEFASLPLLANIPEQLAEDSKTGAAAREYMFNQLRVKKASLAMGITPSDTMTAAGRNRHFDNTHTWIKEQAAMDNSVRKDWINVQMDERPAYMARVFGVDLNPDQQAKVRAEEMRKRSLKYGPGVAQQSVFDSAGGSAGGSVGGSK